MPRVVDDELRQCGQRLQEFRKKANMTQEQLSEAAEVSVAMIKKYEAGTSEIPMRKMFKICKVLKINAYWLMPDTYEEELNALFSDDSADIHAMQSKLCRLDKPVRKSMVAGFNAALDTMIEQQKKIS